MSEEILVWMKVCPLCGVGYPEDELINSCEECGATLYRQKMLVNEETCSMRELKKGEEEKR
jgi:rRNA maturation endonuclease Nob1